MADTVEVSLAESGFGEGVSCRRLVKCGRCQAAVLESVAPQGDAGEFVIVVVNAAV